MPIITIIELPVNMIFCLSQKNQKFELKKPITINFKIEKLLRK